MMIFFVYTIWIWPAVTVFGLAFGIKRLLDGHKYYYIPLIAASVGLFFMIFPFFWMIMQM